MLLTDKDEIWDCNHGKLAKSECDENIKNGQIIISMPKEDACIDDPSDVIDIGTIDKSPVITLPTQETNKSNPILKEKYKAKKLVEYEIEHLSIKKLISCLTLLREKAAQTNFHAKEQKFFIKISEQLSVRNIPPQERNCHGFNPKTCIHNKFASRFTNLLQECDLQWIWHTYRGHKVDYVTQDGLYAGIFEGAMFNWKQAEKIATGEFTLDFDKTKNLTKGEKIKDLMLPNYIQEQLSVLHSDAIRKRLTRKVKADYEDKVKINKIQVESMDIRHNLANYIKDNPPKNRIAINIEECVLIWIAIKLSGNNKSNLVGIMHAYDKLSSVPTNQSTLRRRIKLLEKSSAL